MTAAAGHLIALSDERDQWERLIERAYRDGYRAAERRHADDYTHGYIDGALRRKHIEHDVVEMARVDIARWGPGGREAFGTPLPGDFAGGPAAVAKVRASWLAAGLDLGPGPGWIHLGGATVHHHQCNPACYAYESGWHTIADAIAILTTLPGDYADTIADLRGQLSEGSAAA